MKALTIPTLIITAWIASGCALTNKNVDFVYTPSGANPIAELAPLTIALEVTDSLPVTDPPNRMGDVKNTYGMVMASVVAVNPVRDEVRDAIAAELAHCGHMVVNAGDKADTVINVDIRTISMDTAVHFWDVEVIGNMGSEVKAESVEFQLEATSRISTQAVTQKSFETVGNALLAEYVRSLFLEPRFLDALKNVSQTPRDA